MRWLALDYIIGVSGEGDNTARRICTHGVKAEEASGQAGECRVQSIRLRVRRKARLVLSWRECERRVLEGTASFARDFCYRQCGLGSVSIGSTFKKILKTGRGEIATAATKHGNTTQHGRRRRDVSQ
jgi:hypothetical protein